MFKAKMRQIINDRIIKSASKGLAHSLSPACKTLIFTPTSKAELHPKRLFLPSFQLSRLLIKGALGFIKPYAEHFTPFTNTGQREISYC